MGIETHTMPAKRSRTSKKALTEAPDKPAHTGGTTLIAAVGISPAILTETVWALARGEQRTVIPDEVVAITTLTGQKKIVDQLQTPSPHFRGQSVWQALRQDLLGAKSNADRLMLRIVAIDRSDAASGLAQPLEDIRDGEENLAAAEFILRQVRHYTDAKDRRLIASLAGGRKTMSALLHAAFSHLGRPQDRLTHILVNEPFDSPKLKPLFFYPAQPAQLLSTPDGKRYRAQNAKLQLADVPFAPLRIRFPDIAEIPTRFRDLVQTYSDTFKRDATKPSIVELLHDPARAVVDGLSIELESERQLCVIKFILDANQKQWLQKSQEEALQLFRACHGCASDFKAIRPALREMAQKLDEAARATPAEDWIRLASTDTIKRPLSALRRALEKAGAAWKIPKRDLRLPPFRLVGAA